MLTVSNYWKFLVIKSLFACNSLKTGYVSFLLFVCLYKGWTNYCGWHPFVGNIFWLAFYIWMPVGEWGNLKFPKVKRFINWQGRKFRCFALFSCNGKWTYIFKIYIISIDISLFWYLKKISQSDLGKWLLK